MPFGLTNAPAVFQALVSDVLQDFLNVIAFVYLDDILIFSITPEEHYVHVRTVLQRLPENRLYVKAEKCEFHVSSVSFLGYILAGQGSGMARPRVTQAAPMLPWVRQLLPAFHPKLQPGGHSTHSSHLPGYQPPLFPENELDLAVPSAQHHLHRCQWIWHRVRQALLQTEER